MGAPDLIQWLRRDGLALSLLPSGGLAVQPASKLTDEHRRAIRQHRDALVLALTDGANLKEPEGEAHDPDRHSWPHTTAMNTAEIGAFTERLHLFTRHGLDYTEAETLADGLVARDRDQDDRRLCLECLHLRGCDTSWTCNQWRRAGLAVSGVPAEVVKLLQRCEGFNSKVPQSAEQRSTR